MDVWVLIAADYGIVVLASLPGVYVLYEAEAGQGDQEDCNEALHSCVAYVVVRVECCRFESRGREVVNQGRVLGIT